MNTLVQFSNLYESKIKSGLKDRFSYTNTHQIPRLVKIVLSMSLGSTQIDSKNIASAVSEIGLIAGQKPIVTKAKKSIAAFKIRSGMEIGCKVTLRKKRMYEFLERCVLIALPRVKDFYGFSMKNFDVQGNFSFGIKEQIIFPEIDYDKINSVRGFNVTIVTSATEKESSKALLEGFHLPFL